MKRMFCLALATAAFTVAGARAENTVVVMETSKGNIKIELFDEKAPITVKNFLSYVDAKHYDDTIFHRVIGSFMIQGGGFTAKEHKEKDTKDPIKNESGLANERGTIAMARTNDPDSATTQFFINVVDNRRGLDKGARADNPAGYAVFGKVIEGMDVVDQIKGVKTGKGKLTMKVRGKDVETRPDDVPNEDVVIKSIKREKK
jgi:cyclophilin family peptidyl-prolyl cis-trans isomerase